jgi:hypothetical protein
MDYQGLVKSLDLPAGYTPPTELVYADLHARAISRADLHEDVRGINASSWWVTPDAYHRGFTRSSTSPYSAGSPMPSPSRRRTTPTARSRMDMKADV